MFNVQLCSCNPSFRYQTLGHYSVASPRYSSLLPALAQIRDHDKITGLYLLRQKNYVTFLVSYAEDGGWTVKWRNRLYEAIRSLVRSEHSVNGNCPSENIASDFTPVNWPQLFPFGAHWLDIHLPVDYILSTTAKLNPLQGHAFICIKSECAKSGNCKLRNFWLRTTSKDNNNKMTFFMEERLSYRIK